MIAITTNSSISVKAVCLEPTHQRGSCSPWSLRPCGELDCCVELMAARYADEDRQASIVLPVWGNIGSRWLIKRLAIANHARVLGLSQELHQSVGQGLLLHDGDGDSSFHGVRACGQTRASGFLAQAGIRMCSNAAVVRSVASLSPSKVEWGQAAGTKPTAKRRCHAVPEDGRNPSSGFSSRLPGMP